MQKFVKLGLVLCLGLGVAATNAHAHAFLDKATPPVGGTVSTAPTEIRLVFSEPIVPQFSGLSLTTAGGASVATGKPTQPPGDKAVLITPIANALAPGAYQVKWHAVSVDTHRTQGSFTFSVGR
ncbi:copper homeostasis periplasmic binding protein CopC [Methylocella silvestris]|uniref:CopC domain-containing protein n=1 Tax=Methylocella silvestris TaxID=199596 RepID=A0A2J7THW4_METSI|nr:copper homeostasis periplasmic binding protein CopC [Methylocella silvestris]PNG26364.1 hypothetical protein CR492_08105 [Methylocella silvestris]